MAKKAKKSSINVKMQSTASHYSYTAKRSNRMEGGPNKDGKLTGLTSYDPVVRKHVPFVEKKVAKSS